MRGLRDKTVLITGAAGGIGSATVERFLSEGAKVIALDKDKESLTNLLLRYPDIRDSAQTDVTNEKQVAKIFERIDHLDIVINNAGISIRHPFLQISVEEWRQVIDVNLNGLFYVAQHAARKLMSSGGGVIINMGSTNGLVGYHYYADYNASKAGVIELSRSMALELGPHIRVNAVCPGFIMTPMQEAEYSKEMQSAYADKLPLKRLGTPADVAALFAFLASDEATFITGQSIVIDGGEITGGLASQSASIG